MKKAAGAEELPAATETYTPVAANLIKAVSAGKLPPKNEGPPRLKFTTSPGREF